MEESPDVLQGTIGARYTTLCSIREPYLRRGRACAKLTIPSLLPEEGQTASTDFPQPWNSFGARGTNVVSAKSMFTILPPHTALFKLHVPRSIVSAELLKAADQEMSEDQIDQALAEIEVSLAEYEKEARIEIETSGLRPKLFTVLKHLFVAGNVLLLFDPQKPDKKPRVIPLNRFVVVRDGEGNELEVIYKESISADTMSEKDRRMVEAKIKMAGKESAVNRDALDMFTRLVLVKGKWKVAQEVCGHSLDLANDTYDKNDTPAIALRLIEVDGEDYGRSYVEEYFGDLTSLESLSQSLTQSALAISRLLWLVNPNGVTDEADIQEAENLDVITGKAEDVTALQAEKYGDMSVAQQKEAAVEARLEKAFLMTSSVQRQAERVTAEEIRRVHGELDEALGGLYSQIVASIAEPIVVRVLSRLSKRLPMPKLPGTVRPVILTGVEALGRAANRANIRSFLDDASAIGQHKQEALDWIDDEGILKQLAIDNSLDAKSTLLDRGAVEQIRQNRQVQAAAQSALPGVAQEAAKGLNQA